jgi:hypothetical protein
MCVGFQLCIQIFHDVLALWNFDISFKERSLCTLCTCVILAMVSYGLWRVGIEDVTVRDVMLHHLVNGYQHSGGT